MNRFISRSTRWPALLTMVLALAQLSQADDWKQFGGPNANFTSASTSPLETLQPRRVWTRTLGDGLSPVAVAEDTLIVCHLDPNDSLRETVTALSRTTGKTIWSHAYEIKKLDQQEAFGGRKRSPQATPLIFEDRVITIGFTGCMHALDRETGRVLWRINLVDQFEAIPVQFGFSASPVVSGGRLYVLSGGSNGGLVCLDPKDGGVLWNQGFGEASYATPVVTDLHGTRQLIVMNRESIMGVEAENGTLLWQYALPKQGLTNVPTPIVTSSGLIVSGQGIGGTMQLTIQKTADAWKVQEGWFSDFQFFYCNWIVHNETVIGCDGDLLMAFDVTTGKRLGRWRGFSGANLCRRGNQLFVLHGDGRFSGVRIDAAGLVVESQHAVWDERVWTPPTLVDGQLFSRCGSSISRVDIEAGETGATLPATRIARKELAFKSTDANSSKTDEPVEQIVAALETKGTAAAWTIYARFRSAEQLTIEDHHDLVRLAIDNGMSNEARRLAADAQQDYPASKTLDAIQGMIEDLDRKPSAEIRRGKNGLDYVEFAIVNGSKETLQTYVKGPEKHPFSYGIPLRPGKTRIEKWPVGTKLYEHADQPRGEILLEVVRSFAGRTIDVKASKE